MEAKPFSEDAKQKLLGYRWPGNIRELKSIVELAAVLASEEEITASDISLSTSDALPDVLTQDMTMREYNRRIIAIYMKRYNDDTALVAEKLGIGQTTVYRFLKEMEADADD